MASTSSRHRVVLIASAFLLASVSAATVAAPMSAAGPKCAGKAATVVGSARGEVILGSARKDVIVARGGRDVIYGRGGDDIICGGPGNDRMIGGPGNDLLLGQAGRDQHVGGPGRDRLLGGTGNDSLNGGVGNDVCQQGSGTGPRIACERPAPPAPPAPPTPPPPPEPKHLVMAYSDLDGNHVFGASDVLISKLVDTNGDGRPSPGDTIAMGRWPANLVASAFGDWGIKTHVVAAVLEETQTSSARDLVVTSTSGAEHLWVETTPAGTIDMYREFLTGNQSRIIDVDDSDEIEMESGSPSQPDTSPDLAGTGTGDDRFIDVDILYTLPPA